MALPLRELTLISGGVDIAQVAAASASFALDWLAQRCWITLIGHDGSVEPIKTKPGSLCGLVLVLYFLRRRFAFGAIAHLLLVGFYQGSRIDSSASSFASLCLLFPSFLFAHDIIVSSPNNSFLATVLEMRSLPRSRIIVAVISLISIAFGLTYIYLTQSARFAQPAFPLGVVPDHVCDDSDKSIAGQDVAQKQVIPNFVHYVWILKDRRDFRLSFKTFISIYSAHVFWHPERIYIHTDAAPEIIDKAKAKASGPPWTKRVLAIPGVTLNHVEAPKSTVKGVEINHLEHKADFLRIAALRDFGGVYLDTDAVPLRDIADLRNSGFANILGGAVALSMKHSGYINNGVMMSVPHSTLMYVLGLISVVSSLPFFYFTGHLLMW